MSRRPFEIGFKERTAPEQRILPNDPTFARTCFSIRDASQPGAKSRSYLTENILGRIKSDTAKE
jgi:hypothetical protein